jgi:hypothetical protein
VLSDVLELGSPAAVDRLTAYAAGDTPIPLGDLLPPVS